MKYVIFLIELILFGIWFFIHPDNLLLTILGVIVIIIVSQVFHTILYAR
ncbi:hypothetical protein [Weissella ceti]|nr:hypothetical protein [Weissella ceti]QVK11533.1 hypothetical protein KHQ31_04745 [Weissella ceti]